MLNRTLYAEDVLSLDMRFAEKGEYRFDRAIAKLFGKGDVRPYTRSFVAAVALFNEQFDDWSRECLANNCQGISWEISSPGGELRYSSSGGSDALALSHVMFKAKRDQLDRSVSL